MAVEAQLLQADGTIEFDATAALNTGDVINVMGKAGIVIGAGAAVANGDRATARIDGIWKIKKNESLALVAGTAYDWDDTNKEVVADAAGDFALGIATEAAAAADTHGNIELNGQGPTP